MPLTPDDDPRLALLEALCATAAATDIDFVLRTVTEAACLLTGSRRGLAGLGDGSAVTAPGWFDVEDGWTLAPLRWELGEGAPGHVCLSGRPLVCNSLPPTADGLPEATDVMQLESFACVPLLSGDGSTMGFLEVGNAGIDYEPDDVRVLGVLARFAVLRLHELAGDGRRYVQDRLRAETCLATEGLASLDPAEVLATTATRAAAVVEQGDAVAVRVRHGRPALDPRLDDTSADLVRECTRDATTHTMVSDDDAPLARAAVPLRNGDETVGALLVRCPAAQLDEWSLSLLEIVAERAGVALAHALLYQTQTDIARRLQERLLPLEPPVIDGLEVAVAYRASGDGVLRGGDFIDFYHLTPGHVVVVVGDVAGRGVDVMATTFVTKHLLRALVSSGQLSWPPAPGALLAELHNALLPELDGESFVTVAVASLNVPRRTLQLATAGHPGPLLVRADGAHQPLLLTCPALGVERQAELEAHPTEVLALQPGEALVMFTDGLTEVRDASGRLFEEHLPRLLGRLHGRTAQDVVDEIMAAAERYGGGPPRDDMAVACLRLRPEE